MSLTTLVIMGSCSSNLNGLKFFLQILILCSVLQCKFIVAVLDYSLFVSEIDDRL